MKKMKRMVEELLIVVVHIANQDRNPSDNKTPKIWMIKPLRNQKISELFN